MCFTTPIFQLLTYLLTGFLSPGCPGTHYAEQAGLVLTEMRLPLEVFQTFNSLKGQFQL